MRVSFSLWHPTLSLSRERESTQMKNSNEIPILHAAIMPQINSITYSLAVDFFCCCCCNASAAITEKFGFLSHPKYNLINASTLWICKIRKIMFNIKHETDTHRSGRPCSSPPLITTSSRVSNEIEFYARLHAKQFDQENLHYVCACAGARAHARETYTHTHT